MSYETEVTDISPYYMDWKEGDLKTSNSFTKFLGNIAPLYEPNSDIYIKIDFVSIKAGFYQSVRIGENDTFIVYYDDTPHTLTLPEGNYSASWLSTQVTSQLDTLSLDATITYSIHTNKITITNGAVKEFVILATSKAKSVLGIGDDDVTFEMSTDTTMPYVYDLNDINQVEIRSNLIFNDAYTSKDAGYADILLRVPVKYVGGIITWENKSNRLSPLRGGLSTIYFAMYTIDGDPLNNNGLDWTVHFSRIKKYRRRIYNYGYLQLGKEKTRKSWEKFYQESGKSRKLREKDLPQSKEGSKSSLGQGGEVGSQGGTRHRQVRLETSGQAGGHDREKGSIREVHSTGDRIGSGARSDGGSARSGESSRRDTEDVEKVTGEVTKPKTTSKGL